ncbi:multiubiquitin domain-containing protein [Agromyces sp. GXQ0307]|uniref:multiubiquitin domain-containing protein n=1 Tax=Agromyces sp. GXQ0307 TaxID=3377835 RepID=UPI00383B98BE
MANASTGGHQTTIVINARPQPWGENKISFEQLVALAYPNQPVTDREDVTIRYSRGHDGHGAGTLTTGKDVAVKEGMVFDVFRTTRS